MQDTFIRSKLASVFFLVLLISVLALPCRAAEERYRIRISNKPGGLVQISLDGGTTYSTVGRVTVAANARIVGFAAASYTPHGSVAATAVHGIRIKTGKFANGVGKAQMPLMFSIQPLEFARIPRGYGGHQPRSSGIHTDIFTGHSIFRNESPFVGNPIYVEHNRLLESVPEDYTPEVGDVYVIVVKPVENLPSEVDIENKNHGKVIVKYPDGISEMIAEVVRPVKGTGRYDGTTFTGVGAINTNHGGVITISTAPTCVPKTPEGGSVETRGGFMIQPYYHVWEQGEGSPTVMVVGPRDKTRPHMEGTPPLFDGCINLTRYPEFPEHSYTVQVKIDEGDWESVPKVIGSVSNSFTPAYLEKYFSELGTPRTIKTGVTAVRMLFPNYDAKLTARDLAREASDYASRAIAAGMKPASGLIEITSKKMPDRCVVEFYVDGHHVYTSNEYPYVYKWNSKTVPNGLHEIEITTTPDGASVPLVESRTALIKNN